MTRTPFSLPALGLVLAVLACLAAPAAAVETEPVGPDALAKQMEAMTQDVTQGALRVVKPGGAVVECPLKHTDVQAEIAGFIARVKVTQVFFNPLDEKIEAVYVFPLPHKAAVDDMTMVIGDRRIVGVIKRRAEARALYEQALAQGATAALLEQERPNIFTQSVGNIAPRQEVRIEISYVDVLEYDMGTYEFHFPMVVGPRYIPGSATSSIAPVPPELKGKVGELDKSRVREGPDQPKGAGWAPDTTRVPDASRITPPVLKPGFRNGHDISLSVTLEAGVPIQDLKVTSHEAAVQRTGKSQAAVKLSPADSIPNKAFVLRYGVVGQLPEMAVLTHVDRRGQGYFMLMVQPADDARLRESPPREIVFMVDVSGSMSGAPTAKNIEAMGKFLKLCKPEDTVQVITFAGDSRKLFEKAVPVTPENVERALKFTEGLRGGGGTEMLKGIKLALNDPLDEKRVRIIIMLTDGYIGNEAEIIAEVGRRAGDRIRFWCLGIGSDPNRFLLDGVARQGGGMSKTLGLKDDPTDLVQEVMFRIHRAQLSDIEIDWGGLRIFETYPARVPELWAGRPVVLFGLYQGGGQAVVRVMGNVEGRPAAWPIQVSLPGQEARNDVLSKVWARAKIEDLMQQTFYAGSPEVEEAVTSIALEYRLMSQYTSFVAVDESQIGRLREPARPPRRMLVPVPLPEGTRYEGFFGEAGGEKESLEALVAMPGATLKRAQMGRSGGLFGGPVAGNALAAAAPALAPPPMAMPMTAGKPSAPAFAPAGAMPLQQAAQAGRGRPQSRGVAARESLRKANGRASVGFGYMNGPVLLDEAADFVGAFDADGGYTLQALSAQGQATARFAEQTLKAGQELAKKGDLVAARAKFQAAYLLDSAAAACGSSDGHISQDALEAIEKANGDLAKAWAKDLPGLDKPLDLVLRDKTVQEALDALAAAAGLKVRLIDGSLADAADLLGRKDVRVTFLDLRRATAAQALDWILTPLRLAWSVEKGTVVAGSARRRPGEAAWVYDVALAALPSAKDLNAIKDYQKRVDAAKQAADAFLSGARKGLGAKDDAVLWYAPGQLLVIGDAALHEKAVKLLADLADPKASPPADLADLHKVTSKRAEERNGAAAKAMAFAQKVRTATALAGESWRLLASAARGELDLEALTEVEVAWRQPETAEFLKGKHALLVLRSAWAINEAARALPKEQELALAAQSARQRIGEAATAAVAALEKSPDDRVAYFQALYAAMALRDSESFLAKARPALAKADAAKFGRWPTLASALLDPAGKADAKALGEVLTELLGLAEKGQPTLEAAEAGGLGDNDVIALVALACRRTGGPTWDKFRAESKSLLGDRPLAGSVVVFVNALARPATAVASAK